VVIMSCNCVQEEEVDVRARMLQRLIKSSRIWDLHHPEEFSRLYPGLEP